MKKIDEIIKKYNLSKKEQEEFYNIIKTIYESKEFQKRLTNKYPHHGSITLGEHILEVSCLTYKKCESHNCDKALAVLIAMMHDIYTLPWQNSKRKTKFINKHGFRHPIEAAINSIYYYPELFKDDKKSEILIDGIIHHMYPFPVRVFKHYNKNIIELNNYELLKGINDKYKNMIINSTKRNKIFSLSISKSKYIEGKIVKKCDKKVSFHQIKDFSSLKSLITGKNKKLK